MTHREARLAITQADAFAAEIERDGDIRLAHEYRRYADHLRRQIDRAYRVRRKHRKDT